MSRADDNHIISINEIHFILLSLSSGEFLPDITDLLYRISLFFSKKKWGCTYCVKNKPPHQRWSSFIFIPFPCLLFLYSLLYLVGLCFPAYFGFKAGFLVSRIHCEKSSGFTPRLISAHSFHFGVFFFTVRISSIFFPVFTSRR